MPHERGSVLMMHTPWRPCMRHDAATHGAPTHDAQAAGWPLMQYLSLENMVSVVDAEGFSEVLNTG
jgi:hypothetical protein